MNTIKKLLNEFCNLFVTKKKVVSSLHRTITLVTIFGMKWFSRESKNTKLLRWIDCLGSLNSLVINGDLINWALYGKQQDIIGNGYCLMKWDGKVYIGMEWGDEFYDLIDGNMISSETHDQYYPLSIEQFVKMCKDWIQLKRDKDLIDKVIVHEEQDGSISFEPIYYPKAVINRIYIQSDNFVYERSSNESNIPKTNKLVVWFNFFMDEMRSDSNNLFKDCALNGTYQNYYQQHGYRLIRYEGKIYLSVLFEQCLFDEKGRALPTGSPDEFSISIESFMKLYDEWLIILQDMDLLENIIVKEEDDGSISFGRIYEKE